MKQPKKLTRTMRNLLEKEGLDPRQFRYIKSTSDALTIINIDTGETKVISTGGKR